MSARSAIPSLAPVWGGVLVGGESRRMGEPKQLLELGSRTLVERVVAALEPVVEGIVLLGAGAVPPGLARLERLADDGRLRGPLAGLLAAFAHRPGAAWLVAACDLPLIGPAAVSWLAAQRTRGIAAILPRLPHLPQMGPGGIEPLFALYEPEARPLLERLAASANPSFQHLAADSRVATPAPPVELRTAWRNLNTPEELESLRREWEAGGARG
jgi:molybdopterin-guanine dinucleotide biosynthesis protein A